MNGHDLMCLNPPDAPHAEACLYCIVIAKVRADERERIAQAIEARVETGAAQTFWRLGHTTGIREAARIARNGGSDDQH